MNQVSENSADTNLMNWCKMFKLTLEKIESEDLRKKIFFILKEETAIGREQRYQAISKITDILQTAKDEEQTETMLDNEFPNYK